MFNHGESEWFSFWRVSFDPGCTVCKTHDDAFFGEVGGDDDAGVAWCGPSSQDEDEADVSVDVIFVEEGVD